MDDEISTASVNGFGLFIDTVSEGVVPLWRDERGLPCFYETREVAQREIAEDLIARLEEFLAGEREFEDAISVEEYIMPVFRLADGKLLDEHRLLHS